MKIKRIAMALVIMLGMNAQVNAQVKDDIADCTGRISVSTSSGMAVMAAPDMLTVEGTQPEQIKNG